MAEALRPGLTGLGRPHLAAMPMVLLFILPLLAALVLLLPGLTDASVFRAAVDHPQFSGALALTLWTGLASTVLSLLLAITVISTLRIDSAHGVGFMLAVPHLALALGLGFLIAPTGLLSRIIATALTGWTSPPAWQTVQDPLGLGLMIALVLKETPFLVWAMAQVLAQDELRQRFRREMSVARSLGHSSRSAFLRVVLPQVLQRSLWPIVAVFSYGLTVVDMALVIGPGQPPTLAQLLWTDLNDGDVSANARGAAGTLLLTGLMIAVLAGVVVAGRVLRPIWRKWLTKAPLSPSGSSPNKLGERKNLPSLSFAGGGGRRPEGGLLSHILWPVFLITYALIILALLLQSVSLLWPFPQLLAQAFSLKAWGQFLFHAEPIITSLLLGLATSAIALFACVAWLETQRRERDRLVWIAALAVLCLPALLLALGQYRLLLHLGLTGHWLGLAIAHLPFVMAYVFIMLAGPYRGFDARWHSVGAGLGASRMSFLRRIKWPMLKSPLFSALAVGFAVSVAQYVPSQLAAAGRFSTLPMEAVALSAGGNRALMAAAALVLMLLPLLAFQLARLLGRPRWRTA